MARFWGKMARGTGAKTLSDNAEQRDLADAETRDQDGGPVRRQHANSFRTEATFAGPHFRL